LFIDNEQLTSSIFIFNCLSFPVFNRLEKDLIMLQIKM
jgi:hypothetical protein